MGDSPDGPFCDGSDVKKALNEAFGNTSSTIYQTASLYGVFNQVTTGAGLVAAYKKAGMTVSTGWQNYLNTLTVGDATAIAQARWTALNGGFVMTTDIDILQTGTQGTVTIAGTGDVTITSPLLPNS